MSWIRRHPRLSGFFVLLLVAAVAASGNVIYAQLRQRSVRLDMLADQSFVVVAGDSSKCAASILPSGPESLDLQAAVLDVAKTAVDRGLSLSADYISAAAQDTTSQLKIAELPVYQYADINSPRAARLPTGLECLIIANGHVGFYDGRSIPPALADPSRQKAFDPQGVFSASEQDMKPFFALRSLHFDDFPLSYFEFRLVPNPTSEYFKLVPAIIYFRDSITAVRPSDDKQVEITLTAHIPTSTGLPASDPGKDGLIFQTSITISNMRAGSIVGIRDSDGTNGFATQTLWFTISHLLTSDDLVKLRLKTGRATPFGVANLRVTYRESEKPDLLLQYVGRGLSNTPSTNK